MFDTYNSFQLRNFICFQSLVMFCVYVFSKDKAELLTKKLCANSTLIPQTTLELPAEPEVLHRLKNIRFQVKRVRTIPLTFNTCVYIRGESRRVRYLEQHNLIAKVFDWMWHALILNKLPS